MLRRIPFAAITSMLLATTCGAQQEVESSPPAETSALELAVQETEQLLDAAVERVRELEEELLRLRREAAALHEETPPVEVRREVRGSLEETLNVYDSEFASCGFRWRASSAVVEGTRTAIRLSVTNETADDIVKVRVRESFYNEFTGESSSLSVRLRADDTKNRFEFLVWELSKPGRDAAFARAGLGRPSTIELRPAQTIELELRCSTRPLESTDHLYLYLPIREMLEAVDSPCWDDFETIILRVPVTREQDDGGERP